jgi:hypothetical protein
MVRTAFGASRLQRIAHILEVPAAFFFDGAPGPQWNGENNQPLDDLNWFMATWEGVALAKAFMHQQRATPTTDRRSRRAD